jgi:hypothetical protein
MSTYAEDTSVPVEKSRAEIEGTLSRYGASRFGYMTSDTEAVIGFVMNGRAIKFFLPLPNPNDEQFTVQVYTYRGRETSRAPRDPLKARKMWEQACRSRWRSLNLCIKAKLEACAAGITTFEQEFLAHIVVGMNGRTVGDQILPALDEISRTGKMPALQLTE